jgi:DNA-binding IclR family transcriptional regulator
MGRCFASKAGLTEQTLQSKFEAVRWQQAPEFVQYMKDVSKAAEQSWAADVDHYIRGIVTVASPILDKGEKPRFFIANSTFVGQLDEPKLKRLGQKSKEVTAVARASIFG